MSAANRPRGGYFHSPRQCAGAGATIAAQAPVGGSRYYSCSHYRYAYQLLDHRSKANNTPNSRPRQLPPNSTQKTVQLPKRLQHPLAALAPHKRHQNDPWISKVSRGGDTLSLVFKRAGFNDRTYTMLSVSPMTENLWNGFSPARLSPSRQTNLANLPLSAT